jgi:D-glycero-D-manno-heptose 1,7-bisphosphate phosphatase
MTERYVILDRDGTINLDSDDFVKSPEEWTPLPGSLEAIALLNRHGHRVVVITNQSGIARGLFAPSTLTAMHAKMRLMASALGGDIDAIYVCPHGPDDHCECRKPKIGLFQQFANDKQVDLNTIFAVGDSLRDLQAADNAGAKPILVKTGKGSKTLRHHPELIFPVFETLYDAAQFIITQS